MKIAVFALAWLSVSNLNAQTPAPVVQIAATDVSCAGFQDGRLELTLLAGNPPVNFQWLNLNTNAQGNGLLAVINQPLVLTNLDGGLYRLIFTTSDGVDTTQQYAIFEPQPLQGKLTILSHSNGFHLPCADSRGAARFEVSGGVQPMSFLWTGGETGLLADSLPAGPVNVVVTDAYGCQLAADTVLEAPPPIVPEVLAQGEACFGQNSATITVTGVSGGVPPYRYALNNDPPGTQPAWSNLPAGQYFLTVLDASGCKQVEGIILPSGPEFQLDPGADTSVLSGDTLLLALHADPPADTFIWQPAAGVRMLSGNLALVAPTFSTTYEVTAISADGCRTTKAIRITVRRDRHVYLPNVLAPQAQLADNQSFTVYGSAGIREVARLRVYDRFGRLWFENRNFPVNDPAAGWRGADGADEAPSGVYLWQVVLHYTDGRVEQMMGDVTVVR